jgi:4-hydroxybenzoate polyprenyltransferase
VSEVAARAFRWLQRPVVTERGSRGEAMILLYGGLFCGLGIGLILGAWLW